MGKTAVIFTADQHANSTTAICSPIINLDDGGTYHQSEIQRWLWRSWLDFWKDVSEITKGYRTIGVFGGDLVDSPDNNKGVQFITKNKSTALKIAENVFEPAIDILDSVYVIRGTEFHSNASGAMEEALAGNFTNTVPYSQDINSHWALHLDVEGVRFDMSHHAGFGSGLPWTARNVANKIAAVAIQEYSETGMKLPNVILRGHSHTKTDSGINYSHINLRSFTVGAWQAKTAFSHRLGMTNKTSDVCGYIFLCEDSEYKFVYRQYKPSRRDIWLKI